MGNLLETYLNKRLTENHFQTKEKQPEGPVITISREVGCNGIKLAHLIAGKLNAQKKTEPWKVISKEVFFESARELNMDPEQVRKTLQQPEKFALEEILKALYDKNYKSSRAIGKSIKGIIHQIAADGHCILVGRAGHIIASDIDKSLHIRLVAPLEYRIKTIMENNGLSRDKAIDFIDQVEEERVAFRKSTLGDHFHEGEKLFDMVLNRAEFTDEEIVDIIEYAARIKKLLS